MSYSYSRIKEQKRLEQVPRRGISISILGWQPGEHFDYALAQGGFDAESYIKVMDWVAEKAAITNTADWTLDRDCARQWLIAIERYRAATVAILASTRIIYVLFTPLLF